MRKNIFGAIFMTAALIVFSVLNALGAEDPSSPKSPAGTLARVAQTKTAAILNINNFTTWQRGPGPGQYGPPGLDGDGGIYPRGTKWVLFADGLVWGGKAFLDAARTQPAPIQVVRVGGNTYQNGVDLGWVNGRGATAVAEPLASANNRMYRVRRDWTTMSTEELRRDASENLLLTINAVSAADIQTIIDQYVKDWDEWPVQYGAPYIERNGTPGYQKPPAFGPNFTVDSLIAGNYDEPGVAGSDPASPADQVVYMVYNDLSRTRSLGFYGSEPLGLEIQLTIWGYKRNDALGQLYFKRYKVINKGGVDVGGGTRGSFYIDSMFVAQWSDPDLGAFGDDLAGCDTTLSMGFVYNGNAVDAEFIKFGLPPPAVGYDFLAGPAVAGAPTDTAVIDLKRRAGFKNLPMTSYAYFSAGSDISDPRLGTREGGLRWWKMLRGFVPEDSNLPDRFYPHPPSTTPGKFPLSGDPTTASGFIDGQGTAWSFVPGDRRIVLNSGPFRLSPGDTQEVVLGVVAGIGADRFSSISIMKANDKAVQTTYDLLFQVSRPPASPLVSATELDGRVILDWGSNLERVRETETRRSQPGNYVFEGYNVYQMPSASSTIKDSKRLATYDLETQPGIILEQVFDPAAGAFLLQPIQFGSNAGVRRFFDFSRDHVRDIEGLNNGQEYYVAVTAYSRPLDPGFAAALESNPIVLTVRPSKPFGVSPTTKFLDTVAVTRVSGSSDGNALAQVISPTKITGDTYQIRFDTTGGTWRVRNATKNTTPVTGIANQNGDAASPIVDGIQVKVFGAPNDVKLMTVVANANGPLNPPEAGTFAFNNSGFPTSNGGPVGSPPGNDRPLGTRQQSSGLGASQGWGIHTGAGGIAGNFLFDVFKGRVFRGTNFDRFVPFDWEIRFTAAGGKAYLAFSTGLVIDVPFELWNIGINTPNDPSDDYRCIPWIFDSNGDNAFSIVPTDHPISGGTDDPETDWIYFRNPVNMSPGSAGYDTEFVGRGAAYDGTNGAGVTHPEVMARLVLVLWNGGQVGDPTFPANLAQRMPETGTIFRITATKPNRPADVFQFNTATYAAQKSVDLEKAAIDRVTVFPNPYYAFNPQETNRFVRFVTFNNLPVATATTVRIFNLAGQLVRTLVKDPADTAPGFLRWDLNNQDNFPVASGVYIAHLSMSLSDGTAVTKVLKLAVIQEQEVPDVF